MTEEVSSEALSRLQREGKLVRLELPEVEDVEVYLVRLADGTVVARTRDELSSEIPLEKPGEGE